MADEDMPLIAYEATTVTPVELRASPHKRTWMDRTVDAFAYRCLPLVMANQLGWEALCPVTFSAMWNGGADVEDIAIVFEDEESPLVETHFGHGVLTFKTGYLFRTPPGHNLWVKGPANRAKDGIAPLEGLVEADWGPFTFTMNWRFTRPNQAVTFERGEPFMSIVPMPRHYLQRFDPTIQPIAANPELDAEYEAWKASRNQFNADIDIEGSEAREARWQKHYMHGMTPDGRRFPEHERRLPLRGFQRPGSDKTP
ncbi:MAG: DUF6065 family protein [Planctomycetota bacterium]|nr:DUF6065 family protein [Planctomycetota bacterium]